MIDNLKVSGTNWDFIRNTKHYMLGNHEMMPLTNNQTILKSPTFLLPFHTFQIQKNK